MPGKSSKKTSKQTEEAAEKSKRPPATVPSGKKATAKRAHPRKGAAAAAPGGTSLEKQPGGAEGSESTFELEPNLTLADLPPARRQAFLQKQKQRLLELRDDILGQMQGIAQDSLRVSPEGGEASGLGIHQADAGTEAYDKDFALSLLSQEQDALYEIEEALKRIENGTYGICQMSGRPIPLQRLEAVPHARFTVECQRQVELQHRFERRWESVPQFGEAAEARGEEDEDAPEERETPAD